MSCATMNVLYTSKVEPFLPCVLFPSMTVGLKSKKVAPVSAAIALASMDLPDPFGPYSKRDLAVKVSGAFCRISVCASGNTQCSTRRERIIWEDGGGKWCSPQKRWWLRNIAPRKWYSPQKSSKWQGCTFFKMPISTKSGTQSSLLWIVPATAAPGHFLDGFGFFGFLGFFGLPGFFFFDSAKRSFRFANSSRIWSSTSARNSASTIGYTVFLASSTSWRWSKLLLSSRCSHFSVYWLMCSTNCCTTALGPTSRGSSSSPSSLPFFPSFPFLALSSLPFPSLPFPLSSLPLSPSSSSPSNCL
mmetsp:Transcript_53887/g.136104  ORF Transcript_53887/g.136104 Transcript_53887/m.136104 type:complete len:302 (-) Transcript_53887:1162-2067(-)